MRHTDRKEITMSFTGKNDPIQDAIDALLSEMEDYSGADKEYGDIADNLIKLTEAERNRSFRKLSKDTIFVAAANLISIFAVTHYEQFGLISQRAISMLLRHK